MAVAKKVRYCPACRKPMYESDSVAPYWYCSNPECEVGSVLVNKKLRTA